MRLTGGHFTLADGSLSNAAPVKLRGMLTKRRPQAPQVKKVKKAKNGVKRATCSFLFFNAEQIKLEQNQAITINDRFKLAAKLWQDMTPEQREPYEELAKKDKERQTRQEREL